MRLSIRTSIVFGLENSEILRRTTLQFNAFGFDVE